MSTEEALAALTNLGKEAIEADKTQQATGLPPEAFATLWYLRGKGMTEEHAEEIARAAAAVFEECPQWRLRSFKNVGVRMKLHGALIHAGERDGTATYVEDIVESLGGSVRETRRPPSYARPGGTPRGAPFSREQFKTEVPDMGQARGGGNRREIHITDMRRKWASFSTRGRVTFATDLLGQPEDFRREVIVHELLHLKIPNHGPLFRALLSAHT